MGVDPAFFAVIQHEQVQYYYCRYGADPLISYLFLGPGPTLDFVRTLEEGRGVVDRDWFDGGAIIDVDKHCLVFFKNDTRLNFELRQVLLPFIGTNWPGWKLRWADRGIVELAERLGLELTTSHGLDHWDGWHGGLPSFDQPPDYYLSLITISDRECVRDLGFEDPLLRLLKVGPSLVESVRHWPSVDFADRRKMECLEEGAHIHCEGRRLALWTIYGHHLELSREDFRLAWPGWTIELHHEDLPGQWARSGRAPALVGVGEDAILRQIIGMLIGTRIDPQTVLDSAEVTANDPEQDEFTDIARSIVKYRRKLLDSPPAGTIA